MNHSKPVAEPSMWHRLESAISATAQTQNPRWRALLGAWLAGAGVVRCQHQARSLPRRLSHRKQRLLQRL